MKADKSLAQLFVSLTRRKLVKTFFYFPQDFFYVRQLVRITGEEINSVRRELKNLSDASLVKSEKRGNRLYYWVNPASPLFPTLVVLANKTNGLGAALSSPAKTKSKIKLMAYSYAFATNQKTATDDIDIIIVGKISLPQIEKLINKEQEIRGQEINYMIMSQKELQLRKTRRDPFLVDFFLNCPLLIIGSSKSLLSNQ